MKPLYFLPLIKASIVKGKVRSIVFSLFTILCVICVLLTVSIIMPMWNNMEEKVNNHPYNKEVIIQVPKNDTDPTNEIKNINHIISVKKMPDTIDMISTDGNVGNMVTLSFLHNNYTPIITYGRMLVADNKNEVILPQTLQAIDPITQARTDINCDLLVEKKISLKDSYGNNYTLNVVGTYSTSDPALDTNQIFTTYEQLYEYNKNIPEEMVGDILYSAIIDDYKNKDTVINACSEKYIAYASTSFNIDIDYFNTAIIIMLVILLIFVVLVAVGIFIFVSSCVKSRINELALYRSLGYTLVHIFAIIFSEYLILSMFGFVIAVALSYIFGYTLVNPYLDNIIGNSIMYMNVEISILYIILVWLIFLAIIISVCINATMRTNKINLSVLLKEK